MAKINVTPKVKLFFDFVNSESSRTTDLIPFYNCLCVEHENEWVEAMARKQAMEDMNQKTITA